MHISFGSENFSKEIQKVAHNLEINSTKPKYVFQDPDS